MPLYTLVLCLAAFSQTQEDPVAHFGTTVFLATGLRGDIYFLKPDTEWLPNFKKLKPQGSIYTNELNIPERSFTTGFPGVTDRFEWFALDYHGTFWIDEPGKYVFALASDDGSKLYIDGHQVIDNDGIHGTRAYAQGFKLKQGQHSIRVEYFQGPRTALALMLAVAPPGESEFQIFNTEDYLSPEQREHLGKSRRKVDRQPAQPLQLPGDFKVK